MVTSCFVEMRLSTVAKHASFSPAGRAVLAKHASGDKRKQHCGEGFLNAIFRCMLGGLCCENETHRLCL